MTEQTDQHSEPSQIEGYRLDALDAMFFGGLVMLMAGLSIWSLPVALVVVGAILLVVALYLRRG